MSAPGRSCLELGTFLSAVLFAALFIGWELSVRNGLVPAVVLPAPSNVALRVIEDIGQTGVRMDFLYTLTEVLSGFALAAIFGVSLGALIALNSLLDRALMPLIVAIQTIPKVAVAPVLIIWFGFGIESKIVIVALIDFFPILVNAITGFRSSDPRQILLMRALNASPWQIFIKVRLFNAIPYLMAGMYIAIVLSVIGAVLGEFLGSARGLGSQIVQRQGSMDVVGVFSMLIILSAMGIVLNLAVRMASRRLAFWNREGEHSGL
jgi:NitT/TauT family transport system permease protein